MLSVCKILGFFFFSNISINNTDTLPKKVSSGLENWSKSNPSEKVFLHTDKSTYLAGENIWYKAYVTVEGEPTFLSKIVYIDLVDENGKVVDKQMRPLLNGSSAGDIVIPKSLPSGNYAVNAYSLWMLNYQPFIFRKNIRIYNNDFKPSVPKVQKTDFTVNFFPEGGDLVEGLKSTVAFYATTKQGLPLEITGTIIDQTGKTLASISSIHKGYGKMEITPNPNEALTAVIRANGVEKRFKLPAPKKEGVTLSVNNTNPARTFVQVDRKVADKATYNNVLVVAQMAGKPVYMGMVNFSEDATGMAIPKKNLPPGIMHITLFDTDSKPLAERLVFVNNYEVSEFNLTTDSFSLQNRGKNKFKIDLSKYANPSVSIAITDAERSSKLATDENILSSLLLTSDLKGFVYQPGYYFQSKSGDVTEHLDLLMLTHGWRRFKWDDVLNNNVVALKYPVETGISVGGKVTIPQSTKTIAGGHVDIITKGEDSTTILSKAIVNDKGEFLINDLNFKHKATVYLQGSKNSNQNAKVDVLVNKAYIDSLKASVYMPTIDLDTFHTMNIQNDKLYALIAQETEKNKFISLTGVTVTSRKKSRVDSLNTAYASDLFQMGQTLEVTSSHYISIWQFLREQVSGLTVEGDLANPTVSFTRFAGLTIPNIGGDEEEGTNAAGAIESNGITYYLNEVAVHKDIINTLHASDVAMVKVFKGPEGAALGMSEGGIAIYTKKGTNNSTRPAEKGFFTENKVGYSVTREFFNPDYSGVPDNSFTDSRTTLYWNANLKTDKAGHATLRFYNNDMTKKYKVVIQGIDKNGALIHKEQVIQ
jgi:hypothetical protein